MLLSPQTALNIARRPPCPRCGDMIVREKIMGGRRMRITCVNCPFEQDLELEPDPSNPKPSAAPTPPESQETAMANSNVCICKGCDKDAVARGLCRGHYHRWSKAGKPGLSDFTASDLARPLTGRGGTVPTPAKPASSRPEPDPQKSPPAPAAEPRAPAPGADAGFRNIVLLGPVTELRIGVIGSHLTITDQSGRVLHQVNLDEVKPA